MSSRYGLSVKAGTQLEAPRADGTMTRWTVRRGLGNLMWAAEPEGDAKARIPFHESEIAYRALPGAGRVSEITRKAAAEAMAFWESRTPGETFHVRVPSGLSERAIFLRGTVKDVAGRRLFVPTHVVAKPAEFEAAMTQPWFAKEIRGDLGNGFLPYCGSCFETGLTGYLGRIYDPRDMEPIPKGSIGADSETARLERLRDLAIKTLRTRTSKDRRRLSAQEVIDLAYSLLAKGASAAA